MSLPQLQFPCLGLNELQNEVRPHHSGRERWKQFGVGPREAENGALICAEQLLSIDYLQIRLDTSQIC